MKGIYKITNTINNKCYLGQSVDLNKRLNHHKYLLKLNKHVNVHLQKSYNKYGSEYFIFDIEIQNDLFDVNFLNILEKMYIIMYDSFNSGYNMTSGGDSYEIKQETKELLRTLGKERGMCDKIKKATEDKKVKLKVTDKTTLEVYHFNSISEAIKFTNVHSRKVYSLLRKLKNYNV